MRDAVNQIKEAVERAVRGQIQRDASERGVAVSNAGGIGNALGGGAGTEQMAMFATGYNAGSGETTLGFVFDFSEFDGSDLLI